MATVVSNPVMTWNAAIMAGSAVNQSSSLTITLNITNNWLAQLPVAIQFSNVSADPIVSIYRSGDGGAAYDTSAFTSFSIGRIATGKGQASIVLPAGQYVIQLLNSGPNTATFFVPTYVLISAVQNV